MRTSRACNSLLLGALLLISTGEATAQTGLYDAYLNFEGLTSALQSLTGAHRNLCSLESLGQTAEGRDLWLVTIGNPNNGSRDTNPGILVVANLEANHLIGSMAALYLVDYLAGGYGNDQAVTDLLNTRTFYIVPRLNPDGTERFWTLTDMEFPYKPDPEDEDRDGAVDEDPGDDLNGDGFVTMMRVRDPEGTWMVDPDEPRLMKRADRTKGERGVYKIYTEGRDDDGDGEYNEDGPGGTHLNMNWPHQYPYYQNHAGINQVSEVETRALADFAFTHSNLAMVLSFTPYDNLLTAPEARTQRQAPPQIPEGLELPPGMTFEDVAQFFMERSAPTAILPEDGPYFAFISERFGEMTGLKGRGASGEAGSWPQFAYYQLGLPSFTTPVWTRPEAGDAGAGERETTGREEGGGQQAMMAAMMQRGGGSGDSEEKKWLEWFEESGVRGFADWTPANHPDLGEVEVGGFIPNVRVNPPANQISGICDSHAGFAVWLGAQTAMVELVDTQVEARGDGFYEIEATVQNDSYLPSAMSMGLRARTAPPVVLRLLPAEGMNVLNGPIQQQVRVVNGSGGRASVKWFVQAPPGTQVTLEMLAVKAGGLKSVTLSLR